MTNTKDLALREMRRLVKEHGTQRAASAQLGISAVYFGDVLRGRRTVSNALLEKLGLRRVVVVERAS